jgi:drug/metabolite transporter (DMT)-like permease
VPKTSAPIFEELFLPKALSQFVLIMLMVGTLLVGQLLLKQGLTQTGVLSFSNWQQVLSTVRLILTTPKVVAGLCVSGISTLMWMLVLSRLEFSFAIPVLSGTYYLLSLLAAIFVLGEQVSAQRWAGALLMIVALALISYSK